MPAHVAQHHLGREDLRSGIDVVLSGVLRRRAVGRLEHRDRVAHVRARRDADAADLCGESVGHVVAVEVQRRDHVEFRRAREHLLERDVGDRVFDPQLRLPLPLTVRRPELERGARPAARRRHR